MNLQLRDGLKIGMTDGEFTAIGEVSMRDGMWIAVIFEWL